MRVMQSMSQNTLIQNNIDKTLNLAEHCAKRERGLLGKATNKISIGYVLPTREMHLPLRKLRPDLIGALPLRRGRVAARMFGRLCLCRVQPCSGSEHHTGSDSSCWSLWLRQ